MKTISTEKGEINLRKCPESLINFMKKSFPFGIVRYKQPKNNADYGIVMQCEEKEVYALKQKPIACSSDQAMTLLEANTVLITYSLANYIRYGFSGVLMPSPYLLTKDKDTVESGISYFAFPFAEGREALEYSSEPAYDFYFEKGFSTMVLSFLKQLKDTSKKTGIPLFKSLGLDIAPRLSLGSLSFGFLVVGPHLVCLKTVISEEDPRWEILRSTGITDIYHLPSLTASIDSSFLPLCKPSESGLDSSFDL